MTKKKRAVDEGDEAAELRRRVRAEERRKDKALNMVNKLCDIVSELEKDKEALEGRARRAEEERDAARGEAEALREALEEARGEAEELRRRQQRQRPPTRTPGPRRRGGARLSPATSMGSPSESDCSVVRHGSPGGGASPSAPPNLDSIDDAAPPGAPHAGGFRPAAPHGVHRHIRGMASRSGAVRRGSRVVMLDEDGGADFSFDLDLSPARAGPPSPSTPRGRDDDGCEAKREDAPPAQSFSPPTPARTPSPSFSPETPGRFAATDGDDRTPPPPLALGRRRGSMEPLAPCPEEAETDGTDGLEATATAAPRRLDVDDADDAAQEDAENARPVNKSAETASAATGVTKPAPVLPPRPAAQASPLKLAR